MPLTGRGKGLATIALRKVKTAEEETARLFSTWSRICEGGEGGEGGEGCVTM